MSDIFSSIRITGITCDRCHLYESNWTLYSSVTCIAKKIYETRTDELHTAWINPCMPSLRADTERDFCPVVSSFHQTYKADKRSCYLSSGRALFTHQEPGGHYFSSRIKLTSFAFHLTGATKCKAFIGPRKNSTAKKLKNGSVHTHSESSPSTKLANYLEMHTSKLQQVK